MITVTKPYLPPLDEFIPFLEEIWSSRCLTNNGKFHYALEKALCEYLGVDFISLFANGTLALITALQALEIKGEVITTPYSFIASTHSLWWNNLKPIFADIEKDSFNIDPEKIESALTKHTTAILPVHVYGNPCRHEQIQKIADKYGLKIIYDAAHAFGVKQNGVSIANYGNLTVLSFHATKVYNTFEGGAIVCHDEATKKRIDDLKNFGIQNETTVGDPGINAKMNEFQAAFGLLQLKYIDVAISMQKKIAEVYRYELSGIKGIKVFDDMPNVVHNYSYFPVLIDTELFGITRDEVYERLKKNNIHTRRYFYPLISSFTPYKDLESSKPENLPIAGKIAMQVLCLPIYPDLAISDVKNICTLIKSFVQ
jgi:dTDP-4-amino-4,6-dideoxygalactose transaminase